MTIPPEIQILIDRLNQELEQVEREAAQGLNILRRVMSRFPENVILIQYFAYLNAILLFVDTSKRQIQAIIKSISLENVVAEIIQNSGEELGTLLGRVIEEEIRVRKILNFLEELL